MQCPWVFAVESHQEGREHSHLPMALRRLRESRLYDTDAIDIGMAVGWLLKLDVQPVDLPQWLWGNWSVDGLKILPDTKKPLI